MSLRTILLPDGPTNTTCHSLLRDGKTAPDNRFPAQCRYAAVGASSCCHPGCHADVITPCLLAFPPVQRTCSMLNTPLIKSCPPPSHPLSVSEELCCMLECIPFISGLRRRPFVRRGSMACVIHYQPRTPAHTSTPSLTLIS